MAITHNPDATYSDQGSIALVTPHTVEARSWIDDNVAGEVQWWMNGLVVEHRFLPNLLEGMENDGLVIAGH